jgi:hypothetical protein
MIPDATDGRTSLEPDPFADPRGSPGTRLFLGVAAMAVGGALLLAGLVLHIGEKADRLFLFPMAGRLTMLLGMACLCIGAVAAGQRAATILSIVAIVGGLIAYGIGLVFVEQIGTRIVQGFGLLTALVGLIILLAIQGLDKIIQEEQEKKRQADESERA